MMTLVAFCLEIRTSGTFISWKFKFLVKIVKICKKRKFKKLIKLCIKVLKKVKKTHLKRFFCQSTQDAALSTKSEAIQLNKGELQWNFYYPKFDFFLTFQKKKTKTKKKKKTGPFFRQHCKFSVWASVLNSKPLYFLNLHPIIFPVVYDSPIFD